MSSFDEWSKNKIIFIKSESKASYEAGQQSRQSEIDAIVKQRDSFIKAHHISMDDVCRVNAEIDELKKELEILQGVHNSVGFSSGELKTSLQDDVK